MLSIFSRPITNGITGAGLFCDRCQNHPNVGVSLSSTGDLIASSLYIAFLPNPGTTVSYDGTLQLDLDVVLLW